MTNTIDQQVNDYLQSIGIAVNTVGRGETKRDDWICDAWDICFARNGKAEAFDYFTGTGHRVLTDKARKEVELRFSLPRHPQTVYYQNYKRALEAAKIAVKPEPAGVIYSIIIDSSACDESFDDWCSNFGYDTDSRKALETYLECQSNYNRFRKVFTQSEIEALRDMLQDY